MLAPTHALKTHRQNFEHFAHRFHHLFRRTEPRNQMSRYMEGLLTPIRRKNGWQIAQAIGDELPDCTQRLLYLSRWGAEDARDILQHFIYEQFAHKDAIVILGDVGFVKKGSASIGVQRQRNPDSGRRENCQIATFLSYASPTGHVLLDRRLYVPPAWIQNPERLTSVKAPLQMPYATRAELAISMLSSTQLHNLPIRWVAGGIYHEDSADLRAILRQQQRRYVLTTNEETLVVPEDAQRPIPIIDAVAQWPSTRWQRLMLPPDPAMTMMKPEGYQWARSRVCDWHEEQPGPDAWLVARRGIDNPMDVTYFLSNAPATTSLRTLASVTLADQAFACCLHQARAVAGLDDYEVRHWHSWHRHITLAMMAYAWLASVR